MAYGFEVLNNNSQVLISNQAKSLHFVGKATLNRVVVSASQCGGMRHWAFRISCIATPVPFFTMPTADFYAVSEVVRVSPGIWEISVIRSGTSATVPEVYVFSEPSQGLYTGPETHGLQVFCDDGSISFDSRMYPLVVTGGLVISPPASPINPTWYMTTSQEARMPITNYNWWYSYSHWNTWMNHRPTNQGLQSFLINYGNHPSAGIEGNGNPSWVLAPTQLTSCVFPTVPSKPIYHFPSLPQATRIMSGTYQYHEEYRCCSNYWAMYRAGISYDAGVIKCGWIRYVQGNFWKAVYRNSGYTVGFGVDASSIQSAGSGGNPPYINETLNLKPTAVIIANGNRYD